MQALQGLLAWWVVLVLVFFRLGQMMSPGPRPWPRSWPRDMAVCDYGAVRTSARGRCGLVVKSTKKL